MKSTQRIQSALIHFAWLDFTKSPWIKQSTVISIFPMGRPVLEVWDNSSRFILPPCPLRIFHPTVALQWATVVMIVCTPNLIHSIRYHSPDRLLNSNNVFNVHNMQVQIYILVSLSFTKHQLIPLPFHQLYSQNTAAIGACHRPSHHTHYQSTVFYKPGAILILQMQ